MAARGFDDGRDEAEPPVAQNPARSELIKVLAPSYRQRRNSAGEAPLVFLSFLDSPFPSLFHFPLLSSIPLPYTSKWPPLLAPSAPSLPGSSPRSLSPPCAALRLLSASRGEPGASRRALLVSYPTLRGGQRCLQKLQTEELPLKTSRLNPIELDEVIDS